LLPCIHVLYPPVVNTSRYAIYQYKLECKIIHSEINWKRK